jgi:predicted dehydrogenase
VENVLEITGTQGGIRATHTIGQGSGGELRTSFGRKAGQASAWKSWPLERGSNIYRAEIEAFSSCIQRGAEPLVSGEAGVRGMRLLAACYESARTGKVIAVGEERANAPIRKLPAPM